MIRGVFVRKSVYKSEKDCVSVCVCVCLRESKTKILLVCVSERVCGFKSVYAKESKRDKEGKREGKRER